MKESAQCKLYNISKKLNGSTCFTYVYVWHLWFMKSSLLPVK